MTAIADAVPVVDVVENKAKTVLRVVSGNFLEMYDFMVYGYFATYIAKAYFPSTSAFASLMASLTVFGAGFLMRPLGAVVLGAYIDTQGRRRGLLLTLALMAAGTLLIALVPGYATIGVLAPALVLVGRLLQGFSAGVELGGVSVYLAEIATPGHEGFYTSWQSASQQVAVVFAGSLGVILTMVLAPDAMADYGWRIPFIVGCLIVPFLFFIRESLAETEAFKQRKHHPAMRELITSLFKDIKRVLIGMGLILMSTVNFYLITAYTPTYGREVLKLSAVRVLVVTVCVGISNFCWLPVMAALSDRIGRRPLLYTFSALAIITAYPAMHWLTLDPTFTRLLVVELWLSFIYASWNATVIITLVEMMPAATRTVGFSLAYSLATTIGGFTPAIATALVDYTGDKGSPALCAIAAGCAGIIGVVFANRLQKPPA